MGSERVVFLDFDGVLNSLEYVRRRGRCRPDADRLRAAAHGIDPDAVTRLNHLLERGNAVVVISSSWREMCPLPDLVTILEHRGFVGTVIGKTPSLSGRPRIPAALGTLDVDGYTFRERGDEIAAWLDEHGPVESFVILDDDDDMGLLRDRLVHTSYDLGLQYEHVTRALALLDTRRAM